MRSRYLVCALVTLVVGLSGTVSADFVAYDDFDSTTLNTTLWTDYAATPAVVSDSKVTISGAGGWGDLMSNTLFNTDVQQSYEFLFEGTTGAGVGILGLAGTAGNSAYIRNFGGWKCLVNGTDAGNAFTPVAGDVLELRRTSTNWQVYQNGDLVSQSTGLGFAPSETAQILMTVNPNEGTLSIGHVGTNTVPEPASCIILLSATLGMLAYAWRKRR